MTTTILGGDCRSVLATLPDGLAQCCVTSPPYFGLRDYGHAEQIGAEATPDAYVAEMVAVFREVRRVLANDGTVWLNLGDSYSRTGGTDRKVSPTALAGNTRNSIKMAGDRTSVAPQGLADKQLLMMPARVALALQADGWWLRSDIIWAKPNPMPESVKGSHFTRHMVTIFDYERLSGLPYVSERAGDNWAGDMPSLSEIESPRGKAPLSAKSEGYGYGQGSRETGRREGKASPVFSIGAGQEEQSSLRSHAEGQGYAGQVEPEAQDNRTGETDGSGVSSGDEVSATQDYPKEKSGFCLHQDGQNGCKEAQSLRKTESGNCSRSAVYSRDVAGPSGSAQAPLSLLQTAEGFDPGSRHPRQQGGEAHQGEHRASLPKLQLKERQQNCSSLLVGCPGCDICSRHHGYTFHLSAGRPTSAHEHVFLLTKQSTYFYDADALREKSAASTVARLGQDVAAQAGSTRANGGSKTNGPMRAVGSESRNARNVWTIATQSYTGAHFATMPPELVERCIKAGSKPGDMVLDPFGGAGTTGLVADRLGRNATLIELNPSYAELARNRIKGDAGMFARVQVA